ncbi:MAG: hypothetical protein M1825_003334 [Sarcosagium campestre]|nr:MAG: hypothetical protein M1825_003334 [Sarcosagium campestre]
MASSDLNVLLDMGFEKERAELAVQKSGGLQGALEWLEENQDKPLEELTSAAQPQDDDDPTAEPPALKAGEEARSLVCNDCGKRFRSQAQADEHVDFAESTEEIAPLTEEEKKQKLEDLRRKLAEKRASLSAADKEEQKKNEAIRRKSTKETQDIKEDLEKKERIKQAEAKRREKQAEIAAKERIRLKIKEDQEARRLKSEKEKALRAGQAPPLPSAPTGPAPPTSSGPTTSKPASEYTESRLRLQTPSGTVQRSFPVSTTLGELAHIVQQETGFDPETFVQNFPKKLYNRDVDFAKTIKDVGWVPSGAVIVR